MCFSPDSKALATAYLGQPVEIWDIARRTVRHCLNGHEDGVRHLVWSEDGRILASSSVSGTIRIWEPSTGAMKLVINDLSLQARCITISPDSTYIAAGLGNTVNFWDTHTGNSYRSYQHRQRYGYAFVTSVAFAPNGKQIVSGDSHGRIFIWNILSEADSQSCVRVLDGPQRPLVLRSLCFTSDGWILGNYSDGIILFWNPETGDAEAMLIEYDLGSDLEMRCSSSNNNFVTYADGGNVQLWSYKHYQPVSNDEVDGEDVIFGSIDGNQSGSAEIMNDVAAFNLIDSYLSSEDTTFSAPHQELNKITKDTTPDDDFITGLLGSPIDDGNTHHELNENSKDTIANDEEDFTITCFCGSPIDDGNIVLCENCESWQHIVCYYDQKKVPDIHICQNCDLGVLFGGSTESSSKQKKRERPDNAD
ncbi:MAG: hypothetical protein Q9187_008516 [Circinaria calcarea]